jgi:hypothetical protein
LAVIVRRFAFVVLAAIFAAGCGNGASMQSFAPVARDTRLPGHIYLFWGLAGEIFSRGLDDLAAKIERAGVSASVHSMVQTISIADEIVRNYRSDPSSAPVMLLGHSSGGDVIISIAERLKTAGVPVALAFGFDPTPIANAVPSNVEIFINIFQGTNLIGGGTAVPAPGFRGRLINADLREHREIVHITLDKSALIHDLILDKVVGVAAAAALARQAKQTPAAPPARTRPQKKPPAAKPQPPAYVLPLAMKYVVPAEAPIVLWDSAIRVSAQPGDTLESVSARHAVPLWAVAQINGLEPGATLAAGQSLLVPRNAYSARNPEQLLSAQ